MRCCRCFKSFFSCLFPPARELSSIDIPGIKEKEAAEDRVHSIYIGASALSVIAPQPLGIGRGASLPPFTLEISGTLSSPMPPPAEPQAQASLSTLDKTRLFQRQSISQSSSPGLETGSIFIHHSSFTIHSSGSSSLTPHSTAATPLSTPSLNPLTIPVNPPPALFSLVESIEKEDENELQSKEGADLHSHPMEKELGTPSLTHSSPPVLSLHIPLGEVHVQSESDQFSFLADIDGLESARENAILKIQTVTATRHKRGNRLPSSRVSSL